MNRPAAPMDPEREAAHLDCIHCGICLPACPTYQHLGLEPDSPRGRIYLIRAMKEGRVNPAGAPFIRHMQLCLECRACETACPSGVRFSAMMDEARVEIRKHRNAAGLFLRRIVFRGILPRRRILHACFRLLRLYQRCGMRRLVRASGILRLLPRGLARMEALLPEVPEAAHLAVPAAAQEGVRGRVSLFRGCIMPELFGPVHEATLRVLNRNGIAVEFPEKQTCCGALHLHDGDRESARQLARRNIAAFEKNGSDAVIVNAAGCGAMLREYDALLADDSAFASRARNFSLRVRDIAEYLDGIGIDPNMRRLQGRVTYDDACHLLHGQGIRDAPRRLLAAIPGLEVVELREADRCCGSAGIYNITQPKMADRILDDKIAGIIRTGASIVASGNPGCLLQIQAGLRAKNLATRVMHPIELLDLAYGDEP